jgi:hypothetical protein
VVVWYDVDRMAELTQRRPHQPQQHQLVGGTVTTTAPVGGARLLAGSTRAISASPVPSESSPSPSSLSSSSSLASFPPPLPSVPPPPPPITTNNHTTNSNSEPHPILGHTPVPAAVTDGSVLNNLFRLNVENEEQPRQILALCIISIPFFRAAFVRDSDQAQVVLSLSFTAAVSFR